MSTLNIKRMKNKKYLVTMGFEGFIEYPVEAKDEDEAKDTAWKIFKNNNDIPGKGSAYIHEVELEEE